MLKGFEPLEFHLNTENVGGLEMGHYLKAGELQDAKDRTVTSFD